MFSRLNPVARHRSALASLSIVLFFFSAATSQAQWTQYGGPNQAFTPVANGLAKSWPAQGPPELWRRKLGEGYSSILSDAGRLYTMYRANNKEHVVCLDAKNGTTLWDHEYNSGPQKGHYDKFGTGPNSTPLLTDGQLFSIGIGGFMHCFNAQSGKVTWAKRLSEEFGVKMPECGYAASPIEFQETVIVPIGSNMSNKGGVVAFNKSNGDVVWKTMGVTNSYSTPRLMEIHGETQLIVFMGKFVIAIDPPTGAIKWQFPCVNGLRENISLPQLIADNTILISAVNVGTTALKINKTDSGYQPQQLWHNRKVQFYHGSTIQIGDYVYGSSGETAPHFMVCINIRNGKTAWRKRISKSNLMLVQDQLIILDANGNLMLATASPNSLDVQSEFEIFQSSSWTSPTLTGTTLFLRNRTHITALDLKK